MTIELNKDLKEMSELFSQRLFYIQTFFLVVHSLQGYFKPLNLRCSLTCGTFYLTAYVYGMVTTFTKINENIYDSLPFVILLLETLLSDFNFDPLFLDFLVIRCFVSRCEQTKN